MLDLNSITGFEWDKGNIEKNQAKHGITPRESEEIFLDENLKVARDFRHLQPEERFAAIGRTAQGKILFVVFTLRKNRIRIISARKANKKERRIYAEEIKENPPF